MRRVLTWLRTNLFDSAGSAILTIALLLLFAWLLPPLVRWAVTEASLWDADRTTCPEFGACWSFIRARFASFFYGQYPLEQRWRVNLVAVLFALFLVPAMRERISRRWLWVLLLIGLFPVVAGILLVGGVFGLPFVDTNLWGGLMVNVMLAFVAVAGSFPLGILLALGRRSELPVVRWFCIGFIELWRGVPLLTVLFMAMVMLPLFLPGGATIDRLIRAMIGLTLFTSAYMAEVVRGGLQGVPKGQGEAAESLGLAWWEVQAFVVLPQALRLVVPAIVNTVVDLFKDTTLVSIVGLFDLLNVVNQGLKDPSWLGLAKEGYVFAAVTFFFCCLGMSLYSQSLERRLNPARGR